MSELPTTLNQMGLAQLLLALVLLGAYALLLGGFAPPKARAWSAAVAFLSAGGFVAFTTPWVHGILLVVALVIGVGVFIALAWLLMVVTGRATGAGAHAEHIQTFAVEPLPEDLAAQAQAEAAATRGSTLPPPTLNVETVS